MTAAERLARVRDLSISLLEDGRIQVRAPSRRLRARFDADFVLVLAWCSEPRSRAEVVGRFGKAAGLAFDQLASCGLLATPAEAAATPDFFHGFANVNLQRAMLADRARLDAYRRAIAQVVKPGDVVVDAGTGAGVLAIHAARAGAKRVHAVDGSDVLELARRVVADNGVASRVELVRGNFAELRLAEPADVLVTETFGVMFFVEGASPEIAACARGCLKPSGRIIPSEVSLFLGTLSRASDELLAVFGERDDGLDLRALREEALRRALIDAVDPACLSGEARLARVPVTTDLAAAPLVADVELEGPCAALCGWFDLHLTDDVVLSTRPGAGSTSWHQVVLPAPLPAGRHRLAVRLARPADDRRRLEVEIGPPVDRTFLV